MRKLLLLACFAMTIALPSWAQERTITGSIVSVDDGTKMPGVNVILKGLAFKSPSVTIILMDLKSLQLQRMREYADRSIKNK